MARRGDEVRAERVHLRERTDAAGVAVVVGILAARKRRAARRLDGDDAVVCLAAQLLAHERRDEAAEVGAAARAADDHVGLYAELSERRARLEADDRLVKEHLVENRAEHIAVARGLYRSLHRLGDRAAKRAGRAGMLGVDEAADLCLHRRRRRDARAVRAHHLAAERLLLVGALHHEDAAVKPEESARHRERRSPLARASLGRHAFEPLGLRIVRLRDGGIELVGARGVVALELVVDFCRSTERFFEEVCPHERRRAEHPVEVADRLRYLEKRRCLVKLLRDQFVAKNMRKVLCRARRSGRGVQERRRLLLHVRAHVVPTFRQLVFFEICLIWNRIHKLLLKI